MNEVKSGFFRWGKCIVIVSKDAGLWHLSISLKDRLPTYDELKEARYRFLPGDITVAQLFPPEREFVNVAEFCLHLWELSPGEDPTKKKAWKKLSE